MWLGNGERAELFSWAWDGAGAGAECPSEANTQRVPGSRSHDKTATLLVWGGSAVLERCWMRSGALRRPQPGEGVEHSYLIEGFGSAGGGQAGEAEGAAGVCFEEFAFAWAGAGACLPAEVVPPAPEFCAVWHEVGGVDVDQPGFGPVGAPPVGAVEAAEVPDPVRRQVTWDICPDFVGEARRDDADKGNTVDVN
jgi:hypothetical protein